MIRVFEEENAKTKLPYIVHVQCRSVKHNIRHS